MKLATIPMELIDEGERIREEYGDIPELANNITKRGLIQPLAVLQTGERYLLLAGGRRLKALKYNQTKEVPVRIYDEGLSELEIKSIELHENFFRKDLEWIEQVNIQREIHNLQQQLHGIKVSTSPNAEGWSAKDTAELVGRSKSSVIQDIQLAEAAERFPELFDRCKNKHDASKVLSHLGETIAKEELVKRAKERKLSTNKQRLSDSFILRDFFEGVKQIPDNSIDLCEVDPPYGISLGKIKTGMSDNLEYRENYNEIPSEEYPKFLQKTLKELYRVMNQHSWLIFWFAPEPWFESTFQAIKGAGFTCDRIHALWTKPGPGQTHWPDRRLGSSFEHFFYASKGQPTLARQGRSNLFHFQQVSSKKKIHPTERPVELLQEILGTFAFPGSRILCPFLGSGNTILAAHSLGMDCFGFEKSKQFKDSFLVRLVNNELRSNSDQSEEAQ